MPGNSYLDNLSVLDPGLLSPFRQHSLSNPADRYGFPHPSEQSLSPASATTKYYFTDETKWRAILEHGDFDDIVIGTGFCALAYIDKALQLDPKRRILVLERGGLWLMTHFQNLPLPFNLLLNNALETYPWALTPSTFHSDVKFVHGCFPSFGGRSPFWSAWSPRPPLESMRDFPKSLLATAGEEQFWKYSRDLLNVVEPDQLFGGEYQALQKYAGERLSGTHLGDTISHVEPANLSVGKTTALSPLVFEKFSTPGPLLKLCERQRKLARRGEGSPLTIATDVVVERFEIDSLDPGKRANVLHTSRGALCFFLPRKPNIILATGAIPACTLVLNSVAKQHGRAGSRLTGHFRARIIARFPLPERFRALHYEEWDRRKKKEGGEVVEIAAYYLAGRDPSTGLQYHGEITVTHSPLAEKQQEDAARLCPDFFSAPTEVQLAGSQNHVIVACVMNGEIGETNPECRILFNEQRTNKTSNIDIQLVLSEKEKKLQEVMYQAALRAINTLAGDKMSGVEYWHGDGHDAGRWDRLEPDKAQFQIPGVVSESSTLYIDDTVPLHPNLEPETESSKLSQPSVDRNYRVYGAGNVYVTGSAIFPTSGAWNPTLTICGFAQDLAVKLHARSVFRQIFSLAIASDRVYRLTGTAEDLLNALRGRVNDILGSLSPKGLLNQRGMWQLSWGPVVWKTGTDTSTTGPDLSWFVVHHDNLEFEDGSLHPTYVIAVAGTPGNFVNKVVDFNGYVFDGQFKTPPREVPIDVLDANKAYITLSTAGAIQTLLANPAPSIAGVKTLLHFINGVKSTKDLGTRTLPRFVFTGHSTGGAIASSLALALVAGGVIPAERTLTYSTAAPSAGNAPFATLFERTLRARGVPGADGYQLWNVNLVNTLDVVPQAWCYQRFVSPNQNLSNIPVLYGTPIVPDVIRTTDALVASAADSGVAFKPLPSRYFTGSTLPPPPPTNLDDFLRIAVWQHVGAYLAEVRVADTSTVPESDFYQDAKRGALGEKTEGDVRLNYPVIREFERAHKGEVGHDAGVDPGPGVEAVARTGSAVTGTGTGAGTGIGNWFSTRFGSSSGTKTGAGIGLETDANSGSGTGSYNGTRTGSGTEIGTGTGVGPGAETNNGIGIGNAAGTGPTVETPAGRVAVTPLSSLKVLKYGSPEYNLIPQSTQNHPVLVYRACFPESTSAEEVKSHLQSVGVVQPHRTGTLLIRDHFYASTHKVLCITNGQAQLRFGGEGNPTRVDIEVRNGDVVVIPAVVPHRLLKDIGRDLEVVEGYPKGFAVDVDSRRLGRPQQTHLYAAAALPWFAGDPIYGEQGPVFGC